MKKKVAKRPRNKPAVETLPAAPGEIVSNLVLHGDIKTMSPEDKVKYYTHLCKSLKLNPLLQPFRIIELQGREQLYATKSATDQLRDNKQISVEKIDQRIEGDLCITTVMLRDQTGRIDGDIGAVNVRGLQGDALANARMKSLTKAKRRATLSIAGLGGILDETELETVPGVREMQIDVRPPENPDLAHADIKEQLSSVTNLRGLLSIVERHKTTIAALPSQLQDELRALYKQQYENFTGGAS